MNDVHLKFAQQGTWSETKALCYKDEEGQHFERGTIYKGDTLHIETSKTKTQTYKVEHIKKLSLDPIA